MIALPIISAVFCFAYIIYIVLKYGVPTSLSETYYLLPNKQDWMFSGWCVLSSVPLCIWLVMTQPYIWMPIVITLCLLFVGVSCRYKSECKCNNPEHNHGEQVPFEDIQLLSFWQKIKSMLSAFNPKNGMAAFLHYVCSILAIILMSSYLCLIHSTACIAICVLYPMFILIGMQVPGTYNESTVLDTNDSAWIFFMEVITFTNIFIFIW